jgi:predicted metal-binding protein
VSSAETTIFVCTACRGREDINERPGQTLLEALQDALAVRSQGAAIRIEAVECLAVCKRPGTVAVSGAGKWTYVIGDIDPGTNVEDLIAVAENHAATDNGIVAWKDRPPFFKKGVVSRTPPQAAKD